VADASLPDFVKRMRKMEKVVREALLKAQASMKKYADMKRLPPPNLESGDLVLLSSDGLRGAGVPQGKLAPKFLGPFKVVRMISPIVAVLDLPAAWRCHNSFHVGRLKKICIPSNQNEVSDSHGAEIVQDSSVRLNVSGDHDGVRPAESISVEPVVRPVCGVRGDRCARGAKRMVIATCGWCKECHVRANEELGDQYWCSSWGNHRFTKTRNSTPIGAFAARRNETERSPKSEDNARHSGVTRECSFECF
jgi:hypothetical protein